MAHSTSVSLSDHLAGFVDEQVRSGRYPSASDVVRAGLSLLEEQESRAKLLLEALEEGERSGEPMPFDRDAFFQSMHEKYGR